MIHDDTSVFINPDEFGQRAVFNGNRVLYVVLDSAFVEIGDVDTEAPVAIVAIGDLEGVNPVDKSLVIDPPPHATGQTATTYKIRREQPDEDHQFTTLVLEKQGALT